MAKFVVHDADGNVIRYGSCPDALVKHQAMDGETATEVSEDVTDITHRWDGKGFVEFKPEVAKPTYQELRRMNYPRIEEQLDILYHEGYEAWRTVITEVKAKYPKTIDGTG